MACRPRNPWTFPGLVGAFLDLSTAFLLLLAATLAFLATKLLALFRLRLPCACSTALFGDPSGHPCALLVHHPLRRLSSVHSSLRSLLPFDSLERSGFATPGTSFGNGEEKDLVGESEESCGSSPRGEVWCSESVGLRSWDGGGGRSRVLEGGFEGSLEERVRVLERALEEEMSAHAAVCVELEKDRNAAATAADEAMAMIERLQKEKSVVEMNARQYRRMVEEKASYDEEEMEILKEIVWKREKELFVLEQEVEMYRRIDGLVPRTSIGMDEGPSSLLQEICDSVATKEKDNRGGRNFGKPIPYSLGHLEEDSSVHLQEMHESDFGNKNIRHKNGEKSFNSFGCQNNFGDLDDHCFDSPLKADEKNMDFQKKGIVSLDHSVSSIYDKIEQHDIQSGCNCSGKEYSDKFNQINDGFPCDGATGISCENFKEGTRHGSYTSPEETELTTLDVHVVNDQTIPCEGSGKEKISQACCSSSSSCTNDPRLQLHENRKAGVSRHNSDLSGKGEPRVHEYSSDKTKTLSKDASPIRATSSLDGSLVRSGSSPGLKITSMSSVDLERIRLESEVDELRRRLKVVQRVREKLNFSDRMEKESTQLQLLQDIALQLQEIQKLSEPEKPKRQTSLPPSSSKPKVKLTRRARRTMSSVIQDSI